jgi:A1 cistron-splicing factor AAR2
MFVEDEEEEGTMEIVNDIDEEEDDDDEDAPVIVGTEEIQASLARSSNFTTSSRPPLLLEIQKAYPLLFAAMMPQEDILMTCARALDEKSDVSLVREAAAYLEQVEQQR